MDDVIYRKDAISVLNAKCKKAFNLTCGEEDCACPEYTALRDLPSAQPHWIPVSERLPERGKDVLVTRNYDGRADHIKSCRYVEVASCYGEDDDVSWNSYSDEYKMTPKNHRVVAWMPLPEPYREETES